MIHFYVETRFNFNVMHWFGCFFYVALLPFIDILGFEYVNSVNV